jgi:uncharacterized protein (UPF0335 family)
MNEDLKRCIESIQTATEELKGIRDKLTVKDLYAAQKTFGLSDEMLRLILSL